MGMRIDIVSTLYRRHVESISATYRHRLARYIVTISTAYRCFSDSVSTSHRQSVDIASTVERHHIDVISTLDRRTGNRIDIISTLYRHHVFSRFSIDTVSALVFLDIAVTLKWCLWPRGSSVLPWAGSLLSCAFFGSLCFLLIGLSCPFGFRALSRLWRVSALVASCSLAL